MMAQDQRESARLGQFTENYGANHLESSRKKSGSKKKKPWKRWVKRALFVVGAVSEILGIAQGVLAFMPSDGTSTQVNTGGGGAVVFEQHFETGDNTQIWVGGGAESAAETASEPVLEGLSEEERIYVGGLTGEKQLARAYDYIQNGEYLKADQALEIMLENEGYKRGLRAAALYNQGLARYYQNQLGSAREAFRDSTELKGSAQAYYCLGIVNHEMGEYKQAIDAYSKALPYENRRTAKVDIYLARAAAYELWEDAPEGKAQKDYQCVLGLDQGNSAALAGLRRLGSSEE